MGTFKNLMTLQNTEVTVGNPDAISSFLAEGQPLLQSWSHFCLLSEAPGISGIRSILFIKETMQCSCKGRKKSHWLHKILLNNILFVVRYYDFMEKLTTLPKQRIWVTEKKDVNKFFSCIKKRIKRLSRKV